MGETTYCPWPGSPLHPLAILSWRSVYMPLVQDTSTGEIEQYRR